MFTLLNIRGTCKTLRKALDCDVVYRSCCMEELLDLVASLLEVAKFVDLLFIHCNPDVLFLEGYSHNVHGGQLFQRLEVGERGHGGWKYQGDVPVLHVGVVERFSLGVR